MTRSVRLALGYAVVTLVFAGWVTLFDATRDVAPFFDEWYGPTLWERAASAVLACILAVGIPAYLLGLAHREWRQGRRAAASGAAVMAVLTAAFWTAGIILGGGWF
jgi:hypothetical protein